MIRLIATCRRPANPKNGFVSSVRFISDVRHNARAFMEAGRMAILDDKDPEVASVARELDGEALSISKGTLWALLEVFLRSLFRTGPFGYIDCLLTQYSEMCEAAAYLCDLRCAQLTPALQEATRIVT